jgi:hypothetical protein
MRSQLNIRMTAEDIERLDTVKSEHISRSSFSRMILMDEIGALEKKAGRGKKRLDNDSKNE